jgi:hypothetical protein
MPRYEEVGQRCPVARGGVQVEFTEQRYPNIATFMDDGRGKRNRLRVVHYEHLGRPGSTTGMADAVPTAGEVKPQVSAHTCLSEVAK